MTAAAAAAASAAPRVLACPQWNAPEAEVRIRGLLHRFGYREEGLVGSAATWRRRRRPRWALPPAALLALPTAGLSLLLLRLRREEVGVVVVEQALTGTRIQLAGELPAELPGLLTQPPDPPESPAVEVLTTSGASVTLSGLLLLGRDPGGTASAALRIPDPGGRVSRRHAVLGQDAAGVWAADLESRNGTCVEAADGSRTTCRPGHRYRVDPSGRLLLAGVPVEIRTVPGASSATAAHRIGPRHRGGRTPAVVQQLEGASCGPA